MKQSIMDMPAGTRFYHDGHILKKLAEPVLSGTTRYLAINTETEGVACPFDPRSGDHNWVEYEIVDEESSK